MAKSKSNSGLKAQFYQCNTISPWDPWTCSENKALKRTDSITYEILQKVRSDSAAIQHGKCSYRTSWDFFISKLKN